MSDSAGKRTVHGQAVLTTPRLLLRPFAPADAPAVQHLAGNPAVSATALGLPHPFELAMAEEWIGTHEHAYAQGTLAAFAVTDRERQELIGAVGLMIEPEHRRAELGYWLGQPFWGRAYATEAAKAVVRFGFQALRLHRIHANHLAANPTSGKLLEKLGMRYEGCLRGHAFHRGSYHDLAVYGLLASEFEESIQPPGEPEEYTSE